MGRFLILFCCIVPTLVSGQGADEDMGIPDTVPWQATGGGGAVAAAKSEEALHPLEVRFWDRVEDDLLLLDRWRDGLLDTLRFARSQPQIFSAEPREEDMLYEEHRETALKSWRRGLDYWLAFESLMDRYGEFYVLAAPQEKDAAFLLAYAAFLAQARFSRAWTTLCAKDPALGRLFDEEVPTLGLTGGTYSAIAGRYGGAEFRSALTAMQSYFVHIGKEKALKSVLGASLGPWARLRRDDLEQLPLARRFKPHSRSSALKMLRRREYSASFPVQSQARLWNPELEAPEAAKPPFLPPPPDWSVATISTRAAYAVETLAHWFRVDPSTAERPDFLITRSQVLDLEQNLLPGDILILRRERFLGDIGLDGYWHHAGLYVGTPEQHDAFFRSSAILPRLEKTYTEAAGPTARRPSLRRVWRKEAGELFRRLQPWSVQQSTAPADNEAQPPRSDQLSVLHAGPAGVRLDVLRRFATADALAVLRPRVEREEKGEAILRAMALLNKPYDFQFNARSEAAIASAELIYAAYQAQPGAGGLTLPLSDVDGRWSLSSNALARKFDAEFGARRQQFDWVLFLDEEKDRHEAKASTLEDFRQSWRRPKWTLKKGDE